jgi:putative methionine-R-sulfoxide reductase with GAF domain
MNRRFFLLPKNISLRYRDYSLRTKLVSAFLIVTLIPIGVQFFQNNIATHQVLTNDANTALSSSAAQTAAVLDTFIAQGLSNVSTAAQSHVWKEYLNMSPTERASSETEKALYTDLHAQAFRDQTYIDAVGLMDKNGIDLADTATAEIGSDKSTHRYVAEPLRTGQAYSTVQFSPTTNKLSVYFSSPVRDENGNILGVLRIRYNAGVLQQLLTQSASKLTLTKAELILLDENHIRLAVSDSPELILKSIVPLPADKLAQLQAERRLPADQDAEDLSTNLPEFEEGLNNITSQPIFVAETKPEEYELEGDNTGEQIAVARMDTLPWLLAAAQQRSIYLAPLTEETVEDLSSTLFIMVLVVFAAIFVARTISRPVVNLTRLAKQIAAGNLSAHAQVESSDEIGQLAVAFNQMTSQLRGSLQDLNRRASELATVAEVGIAVSTILETESLLQQVVDLTKERFNLYHSHIYLLDEAGENLVLASGAGEPGRQMMAKGLSIPLNREQSLVARAARERKGVTVNDVTQAPDFLPNPLLPDTRSELAVPMIVGGNVIGVFDIQSEQIGRFTDADVNIQTTLAAQLATSIQNVVSFEQAKKRAEFEAQVGAIGQKIQRSTSIEDTLQTAIRELGTVIGASRVRASIRPASSAVETELVAPVTPSKAEVEHKKGTPVA